MILADSSILIEWQRMPSIQLYNIMTRYHAGICGVTVAEVLGGARDAHEREKSMNCSRLSRSFPSTTLSGISPATSPPSCGNGELP